MQLYFIRHAQSQNNALWAATGQENGRSHDPELTVMGQEQARRLAHHLAVGSPEGGQGRDAAGPGYGLTHLYASLMIRAVHTGLIAAQALGLPLRGWECLHECGGIYQDTADGERQGLAGLGRDAFRRRFPEFEIPEGVNPLGWWNRPYEPREDRLPRARRFLAELAEIHGPDDRVAVFSHGTFYNEVLTALMGLEQRIPDLWFALYNTGITRIDLQGPRRVLVYQNQVPHLPPELIT